MNLAGISKTILGLVLCVFLPLGFDRQSASAIDEAVPTATESRSSVNSLEQALLDINSEDVAVRNAAAAVLTEHGDASLISKLDDIRAVGSRAVRMAIKPVVDLLKNRANLTSDSPDFRRSAAADLGASGRAEAIPFLKQAAAKESVWWVRYTMEEAANFLELRAPEPAVQLAAVKKLGELRSSNSVPLLKELIEAGQGADATEAQQTLAAAARASVEQIESWGTWANILETVFRGISLSSILLIMSLGLAIVFGLMGVINMAHGELMMIGAYATFVTQQAFVAWLSPEVFDWYFPVSLPVAFL